MGRHRAPEDGVGFDGLAAPITNTGRYDLPKEDKLFPAAAKRPLWRKILGL